MALRLRTELPKIAALTRFVNSGSPTAPITDCFWRGQKFAVPCRFVTETVRHLKEILEVLPSLLADAALIALYHSAEHLAVASAKLTEPHGCGRRGYGIFLMIVGEERCPMLSNKVTEIMNREVTTTAAATPIWDAMEAMAAEQVGRIVIAENQVPVGIFTDHDVLRRVIHRKFNTKKAAIREVMTTPVRSVREDAHILDVLKKMYRGKFRHMLVRDETDRMVGLVSIRRIFKVAVELGRGVSSARSVGSIMSRRPVTVEASSSVFDATKRMCEKDTCAVIVLDRKEPKGIFTSRDLLNRVAIKNVDSRKTPVAEVMTANPVIVSRSDPVTEALSKMYEGNFRHMPIKGEKGDLVGMVTMADVLKYAKVLDVDGTVRQTWKEIKEFWDSEEQYTPG